MSHLLFLQFWLKVRKLSVRRSRQSVTHSLSHVIWKVSVIPCSAFILCGCFFSFYSNNSVQLLPAEPKVENLEDHCYAASPTLADHQYASHGPLWLKDCDALQDELVGEIPLVKYEPGSTILTKYDHSSVFMLHITSFLDELWAGSQSASAYFARGKHLPDKGEPMERGATTLHRKKCKFLLTGSLVLQVV